MLRLPNRVSEAAANQPDASTAYQLSGTAVTGHRTFASKLANGDKTRVLAEEVDGDGNPAGAWELSEVTYTTGTPNTLASRVLIDSSTGSLVDWSSVGATPRLSVTNEGVDLSALHTYAAGHVVDLQCDVTSTTNLRVQAGEVVVNGVLLSQSAHQDVALSGTGAGQPLEATKYRLVYAYNNAGALGIEVSATGPVWDAARNYYIKTGDATRRWLGMYWTNGSSQASGQETVSQGRQRRTFIGDLTLGRTLLNDVGTASGVTLDLSTTTPLDVGVQLQIRHLARLTTGSGAGVLHFYESSAKTMYLLSVYGFTTTLFLVGGANSFRVPVLSGLYVEGSTNVNGLIGVYGWVQNV